MSLINDALRRANSDRSSGPQAAAPVPPMQPVDPSPASPRILPWAILIFGVGILAIAAALWFRPKSTPQVARNETSTPVAAAAPIAAPIESPAPQPSTPVTGSTVIKAEPQTSQPSQRFAAAPEPVKTTTPVEPAVQPTQSTAPIAAVTATPPQPEPTPAPVVREQPAETKPSEVQIAAAAPAPAETQTVSPEPRQTQAPRLQAIYYRFKKPTVVINGKTLSPGQSADGIKVVSIQRTSVEVVQGGKYRTLTLQD